MEESKIKCPYCKSTQITTTQGGVSTGKILAGAALAGGIGAILGGMSGKKAKLLCMSCGRTYTPQERNNIEQRKNFVKNLKTYQEAYENLPPEQKARQKSINDVIRIFFLATMAFLLLVLFYTC